MTKQTENRNSLAEVAEELTSLRCVITDMDSFSQEGFGQIAAVAKLALKVSNPPNVHEQQLIREALKVIAGKAEDIENIINCEAEHVNCHWVSFEHSEARRAAASQEAKS